MDAAPNLSDIRSEIRNLDARAAAVENAVKAKLVESYVRLVEATDLAVNTLIYQVVHGRHEETRVAAAKEILDRANLTHEIRVVVEEGQGNRETRISDLRRQLASMREALTEPIDVEEAEDVG